MLGDVREERTFGEQREERAERRGGDALAPVLPADPVPDVALVVVDPAHDVARDRTVDLHGPLGARADQDPRPVRHERGAVPGGKFAIRFASGSD